MSEHGRMWQAACGGVAGERGVADPAPTAEQEAEMSSEF